ncbi:hypothetical protein FUA48_05350 [Flavobacterium alkalisoli]|uniref:Type IX secretion system membrane protein PorP/SprF n=1 Tax=Flavobacterium alkalisoli TaxID=2602769 RepID=A0A5B9FPW8_9FLAO|nr:hypothetical protein [Flavobacterium alkalisoli]QEE49024.1 hypothetical protein FUA48_05350 [Flavobacterium alkalisoli]
MKKLYSFSFLILVLSLAPAKAQDLRQAYRDSIANSQWPYQLPAWGQRITKRGIDLPYPAGIMINYVNASQKINISDLQVGINDLDPVPLDFVKFGEVNAKVQSINTRIDVWALPFVNLYGIFGKTWANTSVEVVYPVNFKSEVDFNGSIMGAGLTLGGGYKHVFGTIDYNHTWSRFDEIKGAIHSQMVTPRFGYIFQSKRHPERNLGLWIGTQGLFINRTTEGSINLGDLNVGVNPIDLDIEGTDWYQNLGPAQKLVVKQIADKVKDKLENIDVSDTTLKYSLKKEAVSHWSMCFGGQYQLNHNLQFRFETGFLGGRSSILVSTNYRFGF